MDDKYGSVKRAVEDAGFFTTGMPMDDGGDRLVCASRRIKAGLSGNSFWLARRESGWFLGVWGGQLYRVPKDRPVADLCLAWLREAPHTTHWDLDDPTKQQYGLVEVSSDELPLV